MSEYRRMYEKGAMYFFTVVTHERRPILTQPPAIKLLRAAFANVKLTYPFNLESIVILPNHLHCVWQLPDNDDDFSIRWRLIKHYFSKNYSSSTNRRNEKLIWQKRYWEHLIQHDKEWEMINDYIHYNPVKHGYVSAPKDWVYSSFQKFVDKGWYDNAWGNAEPAAIDVGEIE